MFNSKRMKPRPKKGRGLPAVPPNLAALAAHFTPTAQPSEHAIGTPLNAGAAAQTTRVYSFPLSTREGTSIELQSVSGSQSLPRNPYQRQSNLLFSVNDFGSIQLIYVNVL